MSMSPNSTSVLSVRINADERAILQAAAEQARTNVSDFVRRKALEAAETDILSRTVVTIAAKDWEAFEGWLNSPPLPNPALRKLMALKPSWEG